MKNHLEERNMNEHEKIAMEKEKELFRQAFYAAKELIQIYNCGLSYDAIKRRIIKIAEDLLYEIDGRI